MSTPRFPLILRRLLVVDATTCLAMAAALIFANAAVADLTRLPAALLLGAGLVLLPLWPQIDPSHIGMLGLMAQAAGVAVLAALELFTLGWTGAGAARTA